MGTFSPVLGAADLLERGGAKQGRAAGWKAIIFSWATASGIRSPPGSSR
jgi:hypothetical protein